MRRSVLSVVVGIIVPLLGLPAAARADEWPDAPPPPPVEQPVTPVTVPVSDIEDFASYDPQTSCKPKAKPGTKVLAAWLEQEHGGHASTKGRGCGGGTSEHKDGRAIDWSMNVKKAKDRHAVDALLAELFAVDAEGNPAALARRMGVMYLIWNDQMYAAWDGFAPRPYLSSSCPQRKKCSPTLRHRDHVHVSLSKDGARAQTSWYAVH